MQRLGRLSPSDIGRKAASDFVTDVDKRSEELIVKTLSSAFPSHGFLGEEGGKTPGASDYVWVIDPLDGTTNFIHSFPMFSVSIALMKGDEVIRGVVRDPIRDETFFAIKGRGAYLGAKRLSVSPLESLEGCLLTTGFPFRHKQYLDLYLEAFRRIFLKAGGIRRAGSAALDLAMVASGRSEGFFELGLGIWDIAAGSLLVTEAGGVFTDFSGGPDFLKTGNVVAGNPFIHSVLASDVRAVFAGAIDR